LRSLLRLSCEGAGFRIHDNHPDFLPLVPAQHEIPDTAATGRQAARITIKDLLNNGGFKADKP